MKRSAMFLALALGLFAANIAKADLSTDFNLWDVNTNGQYYTDVNTHSGISGDGMNFQGDFINTGTDALYINSWSVDQDFSSEGITFNTSGSWWKNNGYSYGSGTALDAGQGVSALLFAAHTGQNGIDTPTGTYTANFTVYGGSDANASDVLAVMSFNMEVVPSYDGFTNTYKDNNFSVGAGQTANFVEIYNNSGSRNIYVDTQAVGFNTTSTNVDFNFLWGWPNEVDAGQSIDSSTFGFTPKSGAPVQTNWGDASMIGGYYPGDAHQFYVDQNWKYNVVPEPSGLLALIAGLGGLGAAFKPFARRKLG